jgi:hypothetical protein
MAKKKGHKNLIDVRAEFLGGGHFISLYSPMIGTGTEPFYSIFSNFTVHYISVIHLKVL